MTGQIHRGPLTNHPSARVRAAVMVDRWIYGRPNDVMEIEDGELFSLALSLELEVDRIASRSILCLEMRLLSSPFPKVKRAALRKVLP